jgi:hypothetical protein
MTYSKLPIGQANPGLIIILVDQSYSMNEPYDKGKSRAEYAASAVNRTLYNILLKCSAGATIKNRCHIGVIGYGASTNLAIAGWVSEIPGMKQGEEICHVVEPDGVGGSVQTEEIVPIWVKAEADNGTPMADAFDLASELVEAWTRDNPNNFPPIVINVTDGKPSDEAKARQAAQRLVNYSTADGNTLLFAAHIGDPSDGETVLPASSNGLKSDCAQFLYDTSSVIPATLLGAAENAFGKARKLELGTRGFVMNAGAQTLTKLLVFGSNPITTVGRD